MMCCQTNDNNANNANNFSYEKVSVSYDVVRTVFAPPKSLITGNWQTHFPSCSSYGTGRTGRHFSYKTYFSSYKKSATTRPHPLRSSLSEGSSRRTPPPRPIFLFMRGPRPYAIPLHISLLSPVSL